MISARWRSMCRTKSISFLIRSNMVGGKKRGGGQKQKRQAAENCLPMKGKSEGSDVGLGLAETLNTVSRFPLTTLLEQVDPLEALEDVAFNDETGGPLEAFVL